MGVSRAASPTNLFNPIGRPTNGVHFNERRKLSLPGVDETKANHQEQVAIDHCSAKTFANRAQQNGEFTLTQ